MQRYAPLYARLESAADPAALLEGLDDEQVAGCLALATHARNDGLAVVLADESLRRAHERAEAMEALQLYRLLVASVVDYAIFALDEDGKIITWNAGAQRLKGYRPNEILGKPLATFYLPEDQERGLPQRLLRAALENGHVEHEGWRVRKDGSTFWARVTITAIRADDGSLRGFAKVTRDLTERRDAEEAMRAANADLERRVAQRTREQEDTLARLRAANDSLESFSFVVSHDLKEPVRALRALLDALREDEAGRLSPEGQEALALAIGSVNRLSGLVNDLLEWSRAGRGEPATVRVPLVEAFAADATRVRFEALARERGATFDVRLRADHAARASPAALSLILGNLVLNAIRHNPNMQPIVRVRSELHASPEGRREVELVVEDNGPGFSEKSRRRFDDPAAPADASLHASGFGLSIVRRAAERFGGTVRLGASAEGGGAVHVRLPAAT